MLIFSADSFLSYINYRIKPFSSIEEKGKKKDQGGAQLNGHPPNLFIEFLLLTFRQRFHFFSCAFPVPALPFRRARVPALPDAVPCRNCLPSGGFYALPTLPVH